MTATIDYDAIWDEYRINVPIGVDPEPGTVDWRTREEIILHYLYLTKRLAARMIKAMPKHVEREELESLASVGLIRAVTTYNNTIGVPFEAHAMIKMRSAVMDGVRKQDWAPRTLRRKQREIDRAEAELKQQLDRAPTPDELASLLELDPVEVNETKFRSEISHHTYIDTYLETNADAELKDFSDGPLDDYDLINALRLTAARTLRNMPVREATVLALRYYANLKLHQVAKIMGLSSVKVGALHREAVLSFCQALENVAKE